MSCVTALLFNVHLSYLVDFILCPAEQGMFIVNSKRVRLICWMCSKLKKSVLDDDRIRRNQSLYSSKGRRDNKYNMTSFWSFYCGLWHQSAYQYSVHTFNSEQVFVSRVWDKGIMFWKYKKGYIYFVIKVARPISFSDLSLHRIEINYEQMTIL